MVVVTELSAEGVLEVGEFVTDELLDMEALVAKETLDSSEVSGSTKNMVVPGSTLVNSICESVLGDGWEESEADSAICVDESSLVECGDITEATEVLFSDV